MQGDSGLVPGTGNRLYSQRCLIFGCPGGIPEIGLSTRSPPRPGRRADGRPPGQEGLLHTPEGARLHAPQLRPLGGRWTTADNIKPDQ